MRLIKNSFFFLGILIAFVSCKKDFEGDRKDFGTPETYFVVDSIYRSGDNRYTTTVEAHWWGTTQSGFIKGYEVSIDGMQTWKFTTSQDSTFLLALPGGNDTADIFIYVRAVNNQGDVDPTPAGTAYPVRNTAPVIDFDYSFGRRAMAFPAFRFNWKATDIDGTQDINLVEIALNDTVNNVIQLPPSVTAASFIGDKTGSVFNGDFTIYNNTQANPFGQKMKGGVFNAYNFFYIRTSDRTGAKSQWVKDSIFLKAPKNGVLFINDYSNNKAAISTFYANRIINLGAGFANFDTVNSIQDEFPLDEFTTRKTFEFFNRIVWATEDPTRSLGVAQKGTETFFTNGGRIFMVLEIPNDVSATADFFSFTPIQSLVLDPGRSFRMSSGNQVFGYNASWPTLKATSIITYPRPFITYAQSTGLFNYDSLARAELLSFGPGGAPAWTGPSNVLSKRIKAQTGKTDFVTLTVPLNQLNGNNNVDSFFKKVVIEELEF